jgi:hypothetical protein
MNRLSGRAVQTLGWGNRKEALVSYVQSKLRFVLCAFVALLALTGCENQKEPAEKAVADIESALTAAGSDAERYVGDQVQAVKDGLASLKAKLDAKDYKGVLADAPPLLSKAQGLSAAKDAAMKAEADRQAAERAAAEQALQNDWDALASAVPAAIESATEEMNKLTKAKKLPSNVTKESLASAESSLEEAKTLWDQASTAQSAGQLREAVTAAQQAKEKADAAATGLGMTG